MKLNQCSYKRLCSSSKASSSSSSSSSSSEKSFIQSVLTTYTTLIAANYISNAMIHPTQKIDYGILNKLYPDNREVDSPFWGTRLPHLFIIPASLTFYDIVIGSIFKRYFGLISFVATPKQWLLHLYCYTFLAVSSYTSFDALLNPNYKGEDRIEKIIHHLKPCALAMNLQWHAQIMVDIFGSTGTGIIAIARNAFAVALVFFPVKALGYNDFLESGLSDHERKMNNLPPKPSDINNH